MAVPTSLRDIVHMEKLSAGNGMSAIGCDRCEYPLTRAGKPGEQRKREMVRSAWKVPLGSTGQKEAGNVMLLCGKCNEEWTRMSKYIIHPSQTQKWVESWSAEEDPWRDHQQEEEKIVVPEVELSAEEKGMFAGELEKMKQEEARMQEVENREYEDVVPSKKIDKEAWLRGEESFPDKDELEGV